VTARAADRSKFTAGVTAHSSIAVREIISERTIACFQGDSTANRGGSASEQPTGRSTGLEAKRSFRDINNTCNSHMRDRHNAFRHQWSQGGAKHQKAKDFKLVLLSVAPCSLLFPFGESPGIILKMAG
jgi:hypothetical protein